MYLNHWGMTTSPFSSEAGTGWYFHAAPQAEALARLHFLVNHGRRLGLLFGPTGCGKTLLLDQFRTQLARNGKQVVVASMQSRSAQELLWDIANQLGTTPPAKATEPELWRAIAERIIENRWVQMGTVLLLDDANAFAGDAEPLLQRLVDIDPTQHATNTVVLTWNSEVKQRLGQRILDRVALRVDLAHWSLEETESYIRDALQAVGCNKQVFDNDAIQVLHNLAGGVPRNINRFTDMALIAAAGRQMNTITAETIEYAADELLVH